jgi:excisionase family DNA binding protein
MKRNMDMTNEQTTKPLLLWTVEEFAAWMRITTMAARCMLRRRELPAQAVIKIGRRVRLRADLVQEWVLKVTVA